MTMIQGIRPFSSVRFAGQNVDANLTARAFKALKEAVQLTGKDIITLDNGVARKDFYGNYGGMFVLAIYNRKTNQNFAFNVSSKGEIQVSTHSDREAAKNMIEGSLRELLNHLRK